MASPLSPSNPDAVPTQPSGPSSEEQFHTFWQKNSTTIYLFCAAIALVIIGRGVWGYVAAEKESSTESAYAAATSPDGLRSFVSSHDGHPLAGAASLQLADQAYTGEKYAEAATNYEASLKSLPAGVLAYRAHLGLAMAQVQSGKSADGESALKSLSSDTEAPSAIRAEATYQLASIAAAAGRTDEAITLSEKVASLDQVGWWAQRAYALRSTLGAPKSAPAAIKLK